MIYFSNKSLILVLLTIFSTAQCLKIKCPLVWLKNRGPGLDIYAIPTSKSLFDNYVVRVGSEDTFQLGNLPTSQGYAIAQNTSDPAESVSVFTTYDVLTNPYDCRIAWELSNDEFSVQLNGYFIGRTTYNGSIVAGDVLNDEIRIATPLEGVLHIKDDLQVLTLKFQLMFDVLY